MLMTREPWSDSSDLQLLRANGSAVDAFAELVRRHQDFVFGAILRVVRERTLAEDLAQEAFLRAYRARGDFRGDAAVRTWLYRIAVNLAKNAVTRRREYPTDDLLDWQRVTAGPEDEVEEAWLSAQLDEAINDLSEDLRVPLVLRELQHLSYQEIADATGLQLNTVRTRILRARRALGRRLEAWR